MQFRITLDTKTTANARKNARHFGGAAVGMAVQITNSGEASLLEPRVIKRRRHNYKLMKKSGTLLKAELRQQCT